jgi:hypothetical protein
MAKAFEEKTINGKKYGLHLMGAFKAAVVGQKLFKLLAPVAGSYFDAATSDALDGMKFSSIATILAENLDELDLEELIEKVVATNLTVNGQALPTSFDEYFKGNLGEMIDVASWAFEVNFKSLFLESMWGRKVLAEMKKFTIQKEQDQSEPEQPETEA